MVSLELRGITKTFGSFTANDSIDFKVDGAIKGMVSRVSYYAYALSYAQIDELLRSGPSNKVINPGGAVTSFVAPPYLRDDWWTSNRY